MARTLTQGDRLLLTYSGQGGQVPDEGSDEDDHLDETWCLYDRQPIDDELYSLFGRFDRGVRIFMLSDSCHSGTVVAKMRLVAGVPSASDLAQSFATGKGSPTLKLTPRRIAIRPSEEENTRGRVSSSSRARLVSSDNPAFSSSQRRAPSAA